MNGLPLPAPRRLNPCDYLSALPLRANQIGWRNSIDTSREAAIRITDGTENPSPPANPAH